MTEASSAQSQQARADPKPYTGANPETSTMTYVTTNMTHVSNVSVTGPTPSAATWRLVGIDESLSHTWSRRANQPNAPRAQSSAQPQSFSPSRRVLSWVRAVPRRGYSLDATPPTAATPRASLQMRRHLDRSQRIKRALLREIVDIVNAHDAQGSSQAARAKRDIDKRVSACMRMRKILPTLVQACDSSDHHALHVLLNSAAQPGWRLRDLSQAMRAAIAINCGGCVSALCKKLDPNQPYLHNATVTPVLDAAHRGLQGVVALRALLENGAKPEPYAPHCWPSALHLAVRAGSAPSVRALLERGAPMHTRNPKSGMTAMMLALDMQNHEVIMVLNAYEQQAQPGSQRSPQADNEMFQTVQDTSTEGSTASNTILAWNSVVETPRNEATESVENTTSTEATARRTVSQGEATRVRGVSLPTTSTESTTRSARAARQASTGKLRSTMTLRAMLSDAASMFFRIHSGNSSGNVSAIE